jgi:hypothetical protein
MSIQLNEENGEKQDSERSQHGKRAVWYVVFAIAAFLTGFVPMWQESERLAKDLDQTKTELRLERIQFTLADGALDARHGDYEISRQKMSQFFTLVREELDLGKTSVLSLTQQEQLQQLSTKRDELITLLARSDAASGERLAEFYLLCRKVFQKS